jgi:hypothetical protein
MDNVRPEAPELLALKRRLSIATQIDPIELSDWIRANMDWLRDYQRASQIEDQQEAYAWLRLEFLQRVRPAA